MSLVSLLLDDSGVLLRWLHVAAVIVWVGSAFALARLDFAMRPRENGATPQTLFLHAGAGFRLSRAVDAGLNEMPLHFKFEAYAAWASGFGLLILIYGLDPQSSLVDPQIWAAPGWGAVLLAFGLLPLVWVAYDFMCRSSGLSGDALLWAVFAFGAALILLLTGLFAASAAFLLVGANLATIMTANIAHAIAPAQKRRLASLRNAAPADEADARTAATRAMHNQYLALPTLFFMLSGHAPWLLAAPHRGFVAVLFLGAGFLVRRLFLKKARGLGLDLRLLAAAGLCLVAAFALAAT